MLSHLEPGNVKLHEGIRCILVDREHVCRAIAYSGEPSRNVPPLLSVMVFRQDK